MEGVVSRNVPYCFRLRLPFSPPITLYLRDFISFFALFNKASLFLFTLPPSFSAFNSDRSRGTFPDGFDPCLLSGFFPATVHCKADLFLFGLLFALLESFVSLSLRFIPPRLVRFSLFPVISSAFHFITLSLIPRRSNSFGSRVVFNILHIFKEPKNTMGLESIFRFYSKSSRSLTISASYN